MTNITGISKFANVSRTTVSRVLNNHPYVSPAKREAVLHAMKELNYVPNFNAVNLSRGKTNVLGVMVPQINHPFFSNLIEGIGSACADLGYSLLVHQTNNDPKQEIECFNRLKYKLIDGLIIGSTSSPQEVIDEAASFGHIVCCEDTASNKIRKVFINHENGINIAFTHLKKSGHESIGLCLGNPQSGVGLHRKSSFFRCLEKYSFDWKNEWYFEQAYSIEDGRAVMKQLAQVPQRPAALIVGNDYVASGIIYEAMKQGIRIPEELAVIGFDNQPISQVMELTTINQPIRSLASSVVALLNSLINGENTPMIKTLNLELIKRNST